MNTTNDLRAMTDAELFDEMQRVRIALERISARLDAIPASTNDPACDVIDCPIPADEHRRG